MRANRLHIALGLGVSAVCLWIAFRNVAFTDVAAHVEQADLRWLLLYPVLGILLNLLRGEIWRILLRRRARVPAAFWAYAVGFLFNNVLPLRVGEAARVLVLARHQQIPVAEAGATAALERVLDLVCVMLVLAATLPVIGGDAVAGAGVLTAAVAVVVALSGIFMLARWGLLLENVIGTVAKAVAPNLGQAAIDRWRELVDALSRLLDPRIGLPAFAGALVVWALTVVAQWTVLRAFEPQAGLAEAAFVVAAVSLAIALPAAPGFIGVYQWAGQQALVTGFGHLYTPSGALAISVTTHAVSYGFSTLLGMVGLWYFGASFKLLTTQLNRPQTAAEGSGW